MPLVNETNELGSTQSLDIANRPRVIHTPNGEWQNGNTKKANILNAVPEGALLHHVIIDLSKVTFIDSVGAKVLKQVIRIYIYI